MIPEEKEEVIEEDDEIGYQEEEREEGIKHDDVVECGGSIEEVRKIFTKVGNKEMAILKMEDLYGTYDVMVVPNAYEKFKTKITEDALIKVHGKVSIKDDNSVIIIADNISLLDGEVSNNSVSTQTFVAAEKPKPTEIVKTLYLKYDTTDGVIHSNILKMVKNYPGTSPIIIKCTGTDKTFKLNLKVNPNNYFLNELNAVLEDSNFKLI